MSDQLTADDERALIAWMQGTATLPDHLRHVAGMEYGDLPASLRDLAQPRDEVRCNGCGVLSVDLWCSVCRDAGAHGGIGR